LIWSITYGTDNNYDQMRSVLPVGEDGHVLLVGTTTSGDADERDCWLMEIDATEDGEGEVIWSRTYGGEGIQWGDDAIKSEGGLIIAGGAEVQDYQDIVLWGLNDQYEVIWEKSYGGDRDDYGIDMAQSDNGSFAVCGVTQTYGHRNNNDAWLMLFDEDGDSLWATAHGGELYDYYYGVLFNDAGDIVLSGSHEAQEGNIDIQLTKYSAPGFATVEGLINDADNDAPLEGVIVTTTNGRSAVTDAEGLFRLTHIWADDSVLTASMNGYNDLTFTNLDLVANETLVVNFSLTHPEIAISVEEFNETVESNSSVEYHFTISDSGDGVLEWSVEQRLSAESGVDPWTQRNSILPDVDDNRQSGVVFVDGLYYVTGGGNDINRVYVINENGEPVDNFPQFSESNYGMKGLAWDGELIWGCDGTIIYGFTKEGNLTRQFEGPFNSNTVIAWDSDSLRFWIAGSRSDIAAYDIDGNEREDDRIDDPGLRIKGLAYFPGDMAPLYILTNPEDDRHVIYKMNPNVGDTIFVCELEPEAGGSPEGAFITNLYDDHGNWVFMNVVNNGADDRIDIWQLKPNTGWMEVEPSFGVIQPDSSQNLTLTLSTVGLDSTIEWEGELVFSQSVGGNDVHIPITMTILINAVDDNERSVPSEFCISSIHPNPFNSTTLITYNLPFASLVSLQLYDLTGRRVATLFDNNQTPGIHTATLTANNLPSGLYFVHLKASDKVFTQKVMLIR